MIVTSQLPIQNTKIFYSFSTCTYAPHFEKGSDTLCVIECGYYMRKWYTLVCW